MKDRRNRMSELKEKIQNLREFFFRKEFLDLPEADIKAKGEVLKKEAHEALKNHKDKQEAFRIWTDQFTGRYDG